jgi:hypothetical protein
VFIKPPKVADAVATPDQSQAADVGGCHLKRRSNDGQTILSMISRADNHGSELLVLGQVFTFGGDLG